MNEIYQDPYKILNINYNASNDEIKYNFKKLALQYHPDKNINKNKQQQDIAKKKYRDISIAYEILSNIEQKKIYDDLNTNDKNSFLNTIFTLLTQLNDTEETENIIKQIYKYPLDICNDIKNGRFAEVQNKIINYIINNKFINEPKINDIFLHSSDNYTNTDNINSYDCLVTYEESELKEHHTIYEIKTTLQEIFNNIKKEITIKKKLSENIIEEIIKVPLYNPQILINHKDDNKNIISRTFINILWKKHKFLKRKNYDILYYHKITLFNLFYGFSIKLKYFNNEHINISSSEPFKEYNFNGNKLKIIIKGKGLPYNEQNRGDLIIILFIDKSNNFYNELKNYFNK